MSGFSTGNTDALYNKGNDAKTGLKPPKDLSDNLRKEAERLPVKNGEIMLDRKNPLHLMLMDR